MGRIKQILVDTEAEDVAIVYDIPDEVRREAAIEDAKKLLEQEAECNG